MPAPALTWSVSKGRLSSVNGYDAIQVKFKSDKKYAYCECRATKVGEPYGMGRGTLIASFSSTPAEVERTFEIYDDFLLNGDGEYRISLFARDDEGGTNDNHPFMVNSGAQRFMTSDGKEFLCMR